MSRLFLQAVALAAALLGGTGAGAAEPQVTLDVAGEVEPVFLANQAGCAKDDYPDAPFRAMRLDDGSVLAFASHDRNRAFRGPSLDRLRRDCAVVFEGRGSERPEDYDDRVWIASLWAGDGQTVFALGHDEYQGHIHPGRCQFSTYQACWWNAVVALRSEDRGASFRRTGERPVASAASGQDVDQGRPRGFFEPSNIFAADAGLDVLIRTSGEGPQRPGTCLFRADQPTGPETWRRFDGSGFSANVDPYRDPTSSAKPCAPLPGLKGNVGSVVFLPDMKLYLAVSSSGARGGESGFYFSTSSDLLHWTTGRLFFPMATPWSGLCEGEQVVYPAIVDPEAPGRNFDVSGPAPYLYFVRQQVHGCKVTSERDLMRVKLSIRAAAGG